MIPKKRTILVAAISLTLFSEAIFSSASDLEIIRAEREFLSQYILMPSEEELKVYNNYINAIRSSSQLPPNEQKNKLNDLLQQRIGLALAYEKMDTSSPDEFDGFVENILKTKNGNFLNLGFINNGFSDHLIVPLPEKSSKAKAMAEGVSRLPYFLSFPQGVAEDYLYGSIDDKYNFSSAEPKKTYPSKTPKEVLEKLNKFGSRYAQCFLYGIEFGGSAKNFNFMYTDRAISDAEYQSLLTVPKMVKRCSSLGFSEYIYLESLFLFVKKDPLYREKLFSAIRAGSIKAIHSALNYSRLGLIAPLEENEIKEIYSTLEATNSEYSSFVEYYLTIYLRSENKVRFYDDVFKTYIRVLLYGGDKIREFVLGDLYYIYKNESKIFEENMGERDLFKILNIASALGLERASLMVCDYSYELMGESSVENKKVHAKKVLEYCGKIKSMQYQLAKNVRIAVAAFELGEKGEALELAENLLKVFDNVLDDKSKRRLSAIVNK